MDLARKIFDWMKKDIKNFRFGRGQRTGYVWRVVERPKGSIYMSTDAKVYFAFAGFDGCPVFGPLETRRELIDRLNAINGVNFTDADLTNSNWPSITLSSICKEPNGVSILLQTLNWIDEKIATTRA